MEIERAMLADYVARLEKQLGAVESRAKDAEADARNARNALAEALIEKARHQKSAKDRNGLRTSPAQSEIESLRAELDTARQDLMRHETLAEDAREATARGLRVEYEQKFHAARERMAEEFQRHFAGRQTTRAADKSLIATPAIAEPALTNEAKTGAASARDKDGSAAAMRRPIFAMVAAAFAGGFALGWSALPNKDAEIVAESIAPTTTESAPVETTAAAAIEPPPAPMTPPPPSALAPSAELPAAAVEAVSTRDEPAESLGPDVSHLVEAYRSAQERNEALSQQLDALQQRLDRANTRAGTAEAALKSERGKTAERSRRAPVGAAMQDSQAPDATPLAQQPAAPGQASRPAALPPGTASPFPTIE
jgi:hypothetical protein